MWVQEKLERLQKEYEAWNPEVNTMDELREITKQIDFCNNMLVWDWLNKNSTPIPPIEIKVVRIYPDKKQKAMKNVIKNIGRIQEKFASAVETDIYQYTNSVACEIAWDLAMDLKSFVADPSGKEEEAPEDEDLLEFSRRMYVYHYALRNIDRDGFLEVVSKVNDDLLEFAIDQKRKL